MFTIGLVLLILVLYWFPLTRWFMPWSDQVWGFVNALANNPILIALIGLLILMFLFRGQIGAVMTRHAAATPAPAGGAGDGRGFFRNTLFYAVGVPIMIVVLLLDIALLGDTGQMILKYSIELLVLALLSGLCVAISGGGVGGFLKAFFAGAAIVAVLEMGWQTVSRGWTNSHELSFEIENGKVFVDPVKSVLVRGGDKLEFSARGETYVGDSVYPPFGNFKKPVDGAVPRGTGELKLLVVDKIGRETDVHVEVGDTGRVSLLGFDLGKWFGGYWMNGKAFIPNSVKEGRLSVRFVELKPDSGFVKMKLQINPEASTVGKVLGLGWFISLLAFLAIIAVLYVAIALARHIFGGLPTGVNFLGFLLLVAVMGALFQAGAITTPPAPKGLLERLERMLTPKPSTATVYTPPAPTGPILIGPGQAKPLAPEEEATVIVPAGASEAKIVAPVGGVWLRGGSGCVRAAGRERCWDIAVLEKGFGGQQKCYPSDITVLPGSRFALKGGSSGTWRCTESF